MQRLRFYYQESAFLLSVPLLHLSFLFTYVMALFSGTFSPCADKRWLTGSPPARSKIMEFLTTLAHVQRGLWLPSLESLPNPATGQGEGLFPLASPEWVCTPDGRGQHQPHPVT